MTNNSQFALVGTGSGIQLGKSGNIIVSSGGNVTVYESDAGTLAITRGAYPIGVNDYATMQYVLDNISGLNVKAAAQVATTANITLSGLQTIDGYAVNSGDRVLVKNQSTATQNGIYIASSGAWTRATDANSGSELASAFLFVENGSINQASGWVVTTLPPITVGSTAITWVQFNAGQAYTAGSGLTLTGQAFSVNVTNASTGIVSNNVAVRSTGTAGQVLRSTGTAGTEATWGALNLASTSAVTGILGIAQGGTNNNGYDTGGMMFYNGSSIITTSRMIYDGNSLTLNLVDNWGGLHILGQAGGEASIALQPDNVSNGSAGQWILYTNGSNLHNQNDFAFYSSELARSVFILQSSTGFLGINQNNPTQAIDVTGSIHTTGSLLMSGSSSGTVTIKTQAASGTYNFNLPITAGGSGTVLTSGGGSASPMTWTTLATIATSGAITDATGTLLVGHGGTGVATLAAHGVLIGQGIGNITSNVSATAGTVLQGNGSSADPQFTAFPTLGINGQTTGALSFASNTLGGNSTTVQAGATTVAWTLTLPIDKGQLGYFLQTDGNGVTSWQPSAGGGTVNSGTTGQIAYYAANGTAVSGTSLTLLMDAIGATQGDILYRNATSWVVLPPGTAGNYLQTGGASANPSWQPAGVVNSGTTGQGAYYASNGTAVSGTNNITISGSNVGISAASPNAPLDVGGLITSLVGGLGTPIALFSQNVNSIAGVEFLNTNTGNVAEFRFIIADTNASTGAYLAVSMPGTGNTSTLFGQTRSTIATIFTNSGGVTPRILALGTVTSTDLLFGTANAERGRFLAGGGFQVGVNAASNGTIALANGGGSGASVTMQNLSTTSAWNFNFPSSAGTSGFPLLSGGGSSTAMTWGLLQGAAGGTGFGTGNSIAANNIIYTSSTNVWSASTVTTYGLSLLAASSAAQAQTTLNITNAVIRGVYGSIDGGGSPVTPGLKGYVYIPYSGTISSWELFGDVSGSAVIDVWKVAYASFPPNSGNTIAGSQLPTLSSQQNNQNTNLTTWTTTVTAGDVLAFNVNSASTVTRLNITLKVLITS